MALSNSCRSQLMCDSLHGCLFWPILTWFTLREFHSLDSLGQPSVYTDSLSVSNLLIMVGLCIWNLEPILRGLVWYGLLKSWLLELLDFGQFASLVNRRFSTFCGSWSWSMLRQILLRLDSMLGSHSLYGYIHISKFGQRRHLAPMNVRSLSTSI